MAQPGSRAASGRAPDFVAPEIEGFWAACQGEQAALGAQRMLFLERALSRLAPMTFPLFLSVLFGAMSTAAFLSWFFSRGDSHHH